MINISITGTTSKLKRETLRQAAEYFLSELKITRKSNPLDIEISLCKLDALGYCDFNYDFVDSELTISLNKNQSLDELITTLAHELVHAKQYLKKELKSSGFNTYWKGCLSNNQEWEDEAYSKEEELFLNFKGSTSYDNQKISKRLAA